MGGLRRAGRSTTFFVCVGMLFTCGYAGTTLGYFDGETDNGATYSGGWVGRATSQTATASGYDGVVTWTLPDTTGVQGQQILMTDNGTSTDCSAAAYGTTVATGLPPTATVYTDANRSASTGAGDWFCYRVQSYWTTNSWTQDADAGATQLGLVVQSVVITNHGTASKLDVNDTIALTFNQKPATPANGTICTFHTGGVIFIGDSACSTASDAFVIGKLAGFTVGGVGHQKRSATVSITASPPWVMTVTVTQTGQNVSGSGSFTPSTSLVSAATTDQATVCTTGGCVPTPSGSF